MKKFILYLAIPAALTTSCGKSFFDINNNPNSPTSAVVSPDLILPVGLERTASRLGTDGVFSAIGCYMGYWAVSTNYGATSENKYDMSAIFANPLWTDSYDIMFDYHSMETKAKSNGQDFYVGISKIMKSLHYQVLVDLFNNVPYSKTMDIKANITPAYDKAEDIYKDLLVQITEGINLIKGADLLKHNNISKADILFHGDKTLWAKFGNTLKLRLLIHMSQVAGFNPASEIATINAEGSGFLNESQTAAVNPGYSSNKANPYWRAFGFTTSGSYSNDRYRANNYALNLLKNLNDERYKYFYRPARGGNFAGQYRGIDFGLNNDPTHIYGDAWLSDIGGAETVAGGTRGLTKSASMDMWLLTSFESLFLQAEAAARGWISADAHALYEKGVTESFKWLGIPNAATFAANYLATNDARITWPAAQADQIKVIIWQKYFAFTGNNHLEAYSDQRRTGVVMPAISIDPTRLSDQIPVRAPYVSSELSYNATNVSKQGNINNFTSKVFWDL